jgi:hypothetical protein
MRTLAKDQPWIPDMLETRILATKWVQWATLALVSSFVGKIQGKIQYQKILGEHRNGFEKVYRLDGDSDTLETLNIHLRHCDNLLTDSLCSLKHNVVEIDVCEDCLRMITNERWIVKFRKDNHQ